MNHRAKLAASLVLAFFIIMSGCDIIIDDMYDHTSAFTITICISCIILFLITVNSHPHE